MWRALWVWGLPQAAILANTLLKKRLAGMVQAWVAQKLDYKFFDVQFDKNLRRLLVNHTYYKAIVIN